MSLNGSRIGENLIILVNGMCLNKPYKIGPHRHLQCGSTSLFTNYSLVSVSTKDWHIRAFPKHVFNRIAGPKRRIDISLDQKSNVKAHGVIGQSFARDIKSGKQDVYPSSGEFTTSAMAEGSIEGTYKDYIMSGAFDTTFKYSLYNANRSMYAAGPSDNLQLKHAYSTEL